MKKGSCLVLLSGGQDSTTSLYWARENFTSVSAINIIYGQRHLIEVKCADKIADLAGVSVKHQITTDIFQNIGDSALLSSSGDINSHHRGSDKLPASFVPARNILFLTIAAAVAFKTGIADIVTGVCQTDFSGYPDCRDNTIKSLQVTLSLAMDYPFIIHTPLMWLTKAESVKLAKSLPGCMDALVYSHTCYEGLYPPCGKCPACILRQKGFQEANTPDPIYLRSIFDPVNCEG
jgi:7-cyano-7-deazaguanine synthase